jgi:hypothetical protein
MGLWRDRVDFPGFFVQRRHTWVENWSVRIAIRAVCGSLCGALRPVSGVRCACAEVVLCRRRLEARLSPSQKGELHYPVARRDVDVRVRRLRRLLGKYVFKDVTDRLTL